jgi:hypothetical protein
LCRLIIDFAIGGGVGLSILNSLSIIAWKFLQTDLAKHRSDIKSGSSSLLEFLWTWVLNTFLNGAMIPRGRIVALFLFVSFEEGFVYFTLLKNYPFLA